jgi:hypothetical protein
MQEDSHGLPEQAQDVDARLAKRGGRFPRRRGIGKSIAGASVLLALDVGFSGSFLISRFVCPFWFLGSVLNNAVQRPGWRLALLRIAIPPLTLGLVLANNALQQRIAMANAARIIAACDEFHAATGRFPKALDELMPRYMRFIPRAKYCLAFGEFYYANDMKPILIWWTSPYGKRVYDFEEGHWRYFD